jgi:hypothetical protein
LGRDVDAGGVVAGVVFGADGEALAGGGVGDEVDDDFVAGEGPRQFMEMWLNMRCSILFHLEAPGGEVAHGDLKAGPPSASEDDGALEMLAAAAVQVQLGMSYTIVGKACGIPRERIEVVLESRPTRVRRYASGYERHVSGAISRRAEEA